MAKTNGNGQHEPAPATGQLVPVVDGNFLADLDKVPPAYREMMMRAFAAAGAGMAAALQQQEQRQPEFYGVAPNDFRREKSPLPPPAQGGSRRRMPKRG
jgi:hypothetical protein